MRLYYLDNPQEQGSPAVLRQLGLHLDESASEHSAKTGHRASLGIDSAHRDEIATRMLAELEREHCLEDKCVIFVSAPFLALLPLWIWRGNQF